jgi:hypothetical protein
MTDKVPVRARLLAGGALLTSAVAAAWLTKGFPHFGLVFWFPTVLVAVPLLINRAQAFRIACWVVMGLLLVLAVLGVWLALFAHLPAGLILVLAAATDPAKAPTRSRVATAVGKLATIVTIAGWAIAFR